MRRTLAALGPRLLRIGEHKAALSTACSSRVQPHPSLAAAHRHSAFPGVHSRLFPVQTRAQHCSCPGMDALPSNKLLVEYQPQDVDRFIEVADAIEEAFPGLVVDGVELVQGAHSFAVKTEDGTVIYAHTGHGSIPGNEELVSVIKAAGAGEAQ